MVSEYQFGQRVVNTCASDDNPMKYGLFVRKYHSEARLNGGWLIEVTDGKGEFWTISPGFIEADERAAPATEDDTLVREAAQDVCEVFDEGEWECVDHLRAVLSRAESQASRGLPAEVEREVAEPKLCNCELRDRQWNPNTLKCERCGQRFEMAVYRRTASFPTAAGTAGEEAKPVAGQWSYKMSAGPLTGIARIYEGDRLVGDLTVSWCAKYGSDEQRRQQEKLEKAASEIIARCTPSSHPPASTEPTEARETVGCEVCAEVGRLIESYTSREIGSAKDLVWRIAAIIPDSSVTQPSGGPKDGANASAMG